MVLIGLGLDALSMNPISIPRVKRILRNIKYNDAKKLVKKHSLEVVSLKRFEKYTSVSYLLVQNRFFINMSD